MFSGIAAQPASTAASAVPAHGAERHAPCQHFSTMDADLRLRVLRRAVQIVGGATNLRNRLSVEPHALDLWLSGRANPPDRIVEAATDLVLRDDMAQAGLAPRTRVLVADAPQVTERLVRALSGHELVGVTRLAEAVHALKREKFGMIVIGVHFDESRMLELLQHVRISRREAAVPVVCVLGMQADLSPVAVQALDRAAKALMANAFLDLREFADDEGGDRRFRRIIDHLILIDGDLHQGLKENR
jgi:DNA-binding transcriptional regulator YdaS (Cro superfamily)